MKHTQYGRRRLASLICIALITILMISFATVSCGKRKEPTKAPAPASQIAAAATPIPPTATPVNTPTPLPSPTPLPTQVEPKAAAEPTATGAPAGLAEVYFKADATTIGAEPVRISILANTEARVYGAQLHVGFDSTLIEIRDADPSSDGVQIEPGPAFPPRKSYVAVNRVDNALGTADFVATLLSPAPPLQGEIAIASFEVVGKAGGAAKIDLMKVILADDNARPIAVESQALELRVER